MCIRGGPLSFRVVHTKTRAAIRCVYAASNTLKNADIKDRSDGTVDVSQAVPAGYHLSSKQSAILKHNDNGWNVLVTDRDDSSGSTVIINPGNNGSGNTTNPIQNPEGTDFSGVAVITNSDGATIYSNANTTQATNRTLANGTKWQIFGVRKVQGDTLAYNLGGSQWVKASDVLIAGGSNNNNPSTNTNQSSEVKTSGTFVVRVPDHPTWATVLWNHDATQHGELLKAGSAWKVYASKQINGKTYYRLGTNEQWVRAEYGYLK